MAQLENDTFVRFMYLPAEVREMVWREAWSHRKPEVCTHLNTESPTEGLHGFPPTQLIVDIDLVLMHACHDSRAFLTSKAGGVRFRYSRVAKCNVPCRAFDPTLDTLYLGWHNWDEVFWKSEHLGRHSNCDADVLKALPDNKHAECWKQVENISLQSDEIRGSGVHIWQRFRRNCSAILGTFPRLKSFSVVVSPHIPLDRALVYGQVPVHAPERRCRLVKVAEGPRFSRRVPGKQWFDKVWSILQGLQWHDQVVLASQVQIFEVYVGRRGHMKWDKHPRRG